MKTTRRTFLKKSALLPAAVAMGAALATTNLVNAEGESGPVARVYKSCDDFKGEAVQCPGHTATSGDKNCKFNGNINGHQKSGDVVCTWSNEATGSGSIVSSVAAQC